MSRTDKTQPFRVRLWDGTLRRVAIHDHRNGICDLPANLAEDIAQIDGAGGRYPAGACRWEFTWSGTASCSCEICHASSGLRAERRADRHAVRRELRDLIKEVGSGWTEIE